MESRFTSGSTLPKLKIITKNGSNESGCELNMVKKNSVGAHVYPLQEEN